MRFTVYLSIILVTIFVAQVAFGKVEYLSPQFKELLAPQPSEAGKGKTITAFNKLPLHFIPNKGQVDDEVIYYAKGEGATIFCTEEGLVFSFPDGSFKITLPNGKRVKPEGRCELPGKVNYFIGNDSSLWRTDIPTFKEVVYTDVFPGINLVYSGERSWLKYTFYVQPGCDVGEIQMEYEGVEKVSVDEKTGELVMQTSFGEIRDAKPVAYQVENFDEDGEIEGVRCVKPSRESGKAVDISFRLIGDNRIFSG